MGALIRPAIFSLAFVVCAALIATHGIRAVALIVAVVAIVTIAQSPWWKRTEERLVRLTGSRGRALGVVLGMFIALVAAINLYSLLHR